MSERTRSGSRQAPGVGQRRPDLDDLEALLALINDPASPHRQEACRHREQPEQGSELYDRLSEDENLVIEVGGRIAAYASWQVFDRHAHLNVLSVAARFQRRGLGRALFEAFREALVAEGLESYTLRAYADSRWAIAFYAGLGLSPCPAVVDTAATHPGLLRYLRMATAQNQWPTQEKVLFFEALG